MPNNAGPPPVPQQNVGQDQSRALTRIEANYAEVTGSFRNRAEMNAIRAMFANDKALADRFLAVAFSALANQSNILKNCTAVSIVQAIKDAASLGLDPTGLNGEAALVPYGDKATLQPMWRGYLKRIRNSGKVVDVDCQIVYMNDDFALRLGTEPGINHVPKLFGETNEETGEFLEERGGYRGIYAWALMPSGKYIIEYLPTVEINEIRDRFSQAYRRSPNDNPWTFSWGEMARKTVIRRLAKRLPAEAVDKLLIAEAMADQVADELKGQIAAANDGLADVRRIAIAAASGEQPAPEQPAGQGLTEPQGGSETEPVAVPVETEAEAGPIADCAVPSPYGDGQTCVLVEGHDGNHKGADKSTWN